MRGEIQLLLHRDEGHVVAVKLLQGSQQPVQMAVEAVDLIHDHHIEPACSGFSLRHSNSSRWLSFLAEMPAFV